MKRTAAAIGVLSAAVIETGLTGLVLILAPAVFARLILGEFPSEPGLALGRIAGIVMVGLAFVTWPGSAGGASSRVSLCLAIYNALAAGYLAYLGLGAALAGVLLWPAVALHGVLAILLSWAGTRDHGS